MSEAGNEHLIIQYLVERPIQTDEPPEKTTCTETENKPLEAESVKYAEKEEGTKKSLGMQTYSLLRQDKIFFAVPQTSCGKASTANCPSQTLNLPCSNLGENGEMMPLGTIVYIGPGSGVLCPTKCSHLLTKPTALTSPNKRNGESENAGEWNSGLCGLRGKPRVHCTRCGPGKKRKLEKEAAAEPDEGKAPGDTEIQHLRNLLQPIKKTACRLKEIRKATEATGDAPKSNSNAPSNMNTIYKCEDTCCQDCGVRLADMGLLPNPDTHHNPPNTSVCICTTDQQKEKVGTDSAIFNEKPKMKSGGIQCGTGLCDALNSLNDYQKSLLLRFANRKPKKMKSSSATSKAKGKLGNKSTEIVWPGKKKRCCKLDESCSKMSHGKKARTPKTIAKKDQPGDGSLDFIDSIKEFDPAMVNKSTQTIRGSKHKKQYRKGCCTWTTSISRTSLKSGGESKERDIATITYDKNDSFTSPSSAGVQLSVIPFQGERPIRQKSKLDIALVQSTKAMSTLDQTFSQACEQQIIGNTTTMSMVEMTVTRFTQRIEQVTEKVTELTTPIADVDDTVELCPCGCGYFQEGVTSPDCSCGSEGSSELLATSNTQGDSKNVINQDSEPKISVTGLVEVTCDTQKSRKETKIQEERSNVLYAGKSARSTSSLECAGRSGKTSPCIIPERSETNTSLVNKETDASLKMSSLDSEEKHESEGVARDELSKPTVVSSMKKNSWDFDREVESLQESIKMYKEENDNLRGLIAKCQCLRDRIDEISQQPPIRGTSSGLIAAIEILQSKCSSKDAMITALAGVLRGSKNLDQFSRSLLSPCLQYVHLDFDPCAMFINLRKLLVSLTTQSEDSLADEEYIPQTYSTVFNAGDCDRIQIPQPTNFRVLREVCKCLLVSWDTPKDVSNIIGYDISVNGLVASRVRSPTRTDAILGFLNAGEQLIVISICSVDANNRFSDPVTIKYANTCD